MAFRKKAFKTADEIPEALRADALELKDGSFVVIEAADEGGAAKALAAERELRKAAEAEAAKNRDAAAELQKRVEAMEASGKSTDAKINELLEKWRKDKDEAIEAAKKPLLEQLAEREARLTRFELDDLLVGAFRKAGGDEARVKRALTLAKQDGWQLIDGKVVRKGADGTPLTQSPDEYFGTEFKKDLPEFFAGTRAAGGAGGDSGDGTRRTSGGDKPVAQWTTADRRAFIEANGPDAYNRLLDEQMAKTLTAPPPTK